MTKRDPAQVDWENELDLLSRMHANRLDAWMWFQHDYMDEVCLESGGEIKMNIGADTDYGYRVSDPYPPCPTQLDSLNIGFWLWYSCYNPDGDWSGPVWNYYNWPDEDWQAGFSRAVEHWVDTIDTLYITDEGVAGYGLAHEFTRNTTSLPVIYAKYNTLNFMAGAVDSIDNDPDHLTSIVDGRWWQSGVGYKMPIRPFFPDSVPNLDYFNFFHYPYAWSGLKISGESFQEVIDDMLIWYDSTYMILTEPNKMPWIATIQAFTSRGIANDGDSACACIPILDGADTVGGYWTGWNLETTGGYRLPSREEMRLQTFLAISRGAKGALTFVFGPSVGPRQGPMVGLLDYNGGEEDVRREWTPYDPQDPDNFYTPYAFNYGQGETPYGHISELFDEIEDYGPLLVKLRVTAIASYGVPDTLAWVNSNASDWLVKLTDPTYGDTALHYWDASTFIDTSVSDSTDYFMLINRVTSSGSNDSDTAGWAPASYRDVAAIFTRPANYYPVIEDIYSDEIWFIDSTDSIAGGKWWYTFEDSIGPGDGNIYKVMDVFTGPVRDSVTLHHDIILTEDLVIDTTGVLTIEPGRTVYILPDSSIEITCYGEIVANGLSSDSIRFIPWGDSSAAGDWYGIRLMPGSEAVMEYCAVRYAENGVYMDSSSQAALSSCLISDNDDSGIRVKGADLDLDSSVVTYNDYGVYVSHDGIAHIDHSELSDNALTGVWNYPGTLVMRDCTVEDNGITGIRCRASIDSIYTTAVSGPKYGIYLEGVEETIIDSCVITSTASSGSYWGIHAIKANSINPEVHVYNDSIANFPQGGIYLWEASGNGIIRNTDVVSCGTYGVYYNNSSTPISGGDGTKNLFYQNTYGLYLTSSSSPAVRRTHFKNNQSHGARVNLNCSPDFGLPSDSGFNSFTKIMTPVFYFDLVNDLRNDSLKAFGNYWGESTPVAGEIVNAMYVPYLTDDPLPKVVPPGTPEALPEDFALTKIYPNPSNPVSAIKFNLTSPQHVSVIIYNILGQRVRTLLNDHMAAGQSTLIWDGRDNRGDYVASGVYLCQFRTAEKQKTIKMTVLR